MLLVSFVAFLWAIPSLIRANLRSSAVGLRVYSCPFAVFFASFCGYSFLAIGYSRSALVGLILTARKAGSMQARAAASPRLATLTSSETKSIAETPYSSPSINRPVANATPIPTTSPIQTIFMPWSVTDLKMLFTWAPRAMRIANSRVL